MQNTVRLTSFVLDKPTGRILFRLTLLMLYNVECSLKFKRSAHIQIQYSSFTQWMIRSVFQTKQNIIQVGIITFQPSYAVFYPLSRKSIVKGQYTIRYLSS